MEKLTGHKIFLLDAVGALSSVVLLFVLYSFEAFFGMPKNVLIVFIGIASVFVVYSSSIFFIKPENWRFYLKIIAALNMAYCLFTIYHLLQNIGALTLYGYVYFIGEICVITALSIFEFNFSKSNR